MTIPSRLGHVCSHQATGFTKKASPVTVVERPVVAVNKEVLKYWNDCFLFCGFWCWIWSTITRLLWVNAIIILKTRSKYVKTYVSKYICIQFIHIHIHETSQATIFHTKPASNSLLHKYLESQSLSNSHADSLLTRRTAGAFAKYDRLYKTHGTHAVKGVEFFFGFGTYMKYPRIVSNDKCVCIYIPLDPKTMKNEGFRPPNIGYKNEGCGFPWYMYKSGLVMVFHKLLSTNVSTKQKRQICTLSHYHRWAPNQTPPSNPAPQNPSWWLASERYARQFGNHFSTKNEVKMITKYWKPPASSLLSC